MLLTAAALALSLAPVDPGPVLLAPHAAVEREWASARPNRGGAGRFGDSNVAAVWRGASFAERLTWRCIRAHEIPGGSYFSENPDSSASGAGQWIDATWRGLAQWVRVNGHYVARQYQHAAHAPAWVQDAAYRHVYARDGLAMWRGTGCPGTE